MGVTFMPNEWITDKYPETEDDILIYDFNYGISIGYYLQKVSHFYRIDGVPLNLVAGWMKLPEPPKTNTPIKSNFDRYTIRIQ